MKKIVTVALSSILAVGLSSCFGSEVASAPKQQNYTNQVNHWGGILGCGLNSQQKESNLKDAQFLMRMGSGYDSTTSTATSGQSCLIATTKPDSMFIANPTATMTFDKQADLSTLEKSLGVDVSGKYGGDRFSVSAAASFAQASKDDKYSMNIIYLYKYSGVAVFKNGALGQGDDALTPVAREYVHTKEDPKNDVFQRMCGDSYVEQMDVGSLLAVRLKLSFNSHSDQQKLAAELKGEYGMASISAAIRMASQKSNVHSDFSLSAVQMGGDPQKLNDIFGKRQDSGNYPFVDCGDPTSKNANACNEMINSVIDYAVSMKDQLSTKGGELDCDKLYYSNPVNSPYMSLGITRNSFKPSDETLHAMEDMTEKYDQAQKDYIFVKHYREGLSTQLDSFTKEVLRNSEVQLSNQLSNVYLSPVYRVMSCYRGFVSPECVTIKANVDNALKKYQLDDTALTMLDYLQHNAYGIDLYTMEESGLPNPTPSDFAISKGCILVPVSDWEDERYALNCNGYWLKTPTEIHLHNNGTDTKLILDAPLAYFYSEQGIPSNQLWQFTYFSSLSKSDLITFTQSNISKVKYISNSLDAFAKKKGETGDGIKLNQGIKANLIKQYDNPA